MRSRHFLGWERVARVLVTGAAGSLGSSVVPALRRAGFEVVRLDRALDSAHELVGGSGLPNLLSGCDGVLHLAACSRVGDAEQDPPRAQHDNIDATAALLGAVEALRPRPWLILSSSREVYGNAKTSPTAESSPLSPLNLYGATKAAAEALVQRDVRSGLRATILRLANVYGGADDQPDRLIPAFVTAAVAVQPLFVRGSTRTLDLVHARDVDAAFVAAARALHQGSRAGLTVNVCSGTETALGPLATQVVTLAASSSSVHHEPPAAYDVTRFVGDNRLASETLGWSPRVPLDVGLVELIYAAQARRRPRNTEPA